MRSLVFSLCLCHNHLKVNFCPDNEQCSIVHCKHMHFYYSHSLPFFVPGRISKLSFMRLDATTRTLCPVSLLTPFLSKSGLSSTQKRKVMARHPITAQLLVRGAGSLVGVVPKDDRTKQQSLQPSNRFQEYNVICNNMLVKIIFTVIPAFLT